MKCQRVVVGSSLAQLRFPKICNPGGVQQARSRTSASRNSDAFWRKGAAEALNKLAHLHPHCGLLLGTEEMDCLYLYASKEWRLAEFYTDTIQCVVQSIRHRNAIIFYCITS